MLSFPFKDLFLFCFHPTIHMILLRCLLSSDNIPTTDYCTQDNLLDFQRFLLSSGISCTHSICLEFCWGVGCRGVGLKSNEKTALSSQKTLNKQNEVIGTTDCVLQWGWRPSLDYSWLSFKQHLSTSTAAFSPHNAMRISVVWSFASHTCSDPKLLHRSRNIFRRAACLFSQAADGAVCLFEVDHVPLRSIHLGMKCNQWC